MQAIQTKLINGNRIKAVAWGGSVTIKFDNSCNSHAEAHAKAAKALVEKMGWSGTYVSGGMPDGSGDSYVFVNVNSNDSSFMVESKDD